MIYHRLFGHISRAHLHNTGLCGVILSCAVIAGCSQAPNIPLFPGVHKIEIEQGNIVSQDMIDRLKPGMTKSQVRFVLGTPLIADPFNQDRWVYYYSLLDANDKLVKEQVSIHFVDDVLDSFTGDYTHSGSVEGDNSFAQ